MTGNPAVTSGDSVPAVVVLAGGTSRRFGADKLSADVVVVGPPRPTDRPVRFVREQPPGGGPAAALVAGLLAVADAAAVIVLPGDAPDSGWAVATLLGALPDDPDSAVIAVAADGREQPLQLALRPRAVRTVIDLAGPDRGAGASARRLVLGLGAALVRCPLPADQTFDIDTPEQLARYLERRHDRLS